MMTNFWNDPIQELHSETVDQRSKAFHSLRGREGTPDNPTKQIKASFALANINVLYHQENTEQQ